MYEWSQFILTDCPFIQVQKLLDYCPPLSSGDDACVLSDRSLAAVTALGLYAVNSKLQVGNIIRGLIMINLMFVPSS